MVLPNAIGWNPDRITTSLDAVVLGMHARLDNPETIRAKELGVKYTPIQSTCTSKQRIKLEW